MCVAFSPDGKTLAAGEGNRWGNSRLALPSPPAGSSLDSSEENPIHLFEIATGKTLFSGKTSSDFAEWNTESVAFTADGKTLATAHSNRIVRLWSLVTRKELFRLEIEPHKPPPPIPKSDGTIEYNVEIWDANALTSAVFSPDGKTLAAVRLDGAIQLWETATGKERGRLPGRKELNGPIAFSPTGKILATGSKDGSVSFWDVLTGREVCHYTGHQGRVLCLAFSPDGKTLASGSDDTTILLWEVKHWPAAKKFPAKHLQLEPLWTDL
jgi:WD40 repeat protein